MNVVGKIAVQKNIRLLSKNRIEMDVSHLPKGVHFIRVSNKKGTEILQFIKQ